MRRTTATAAGVSSLPEECRFKRGLQPAGPGIVVPVAVEDERAIGLRVADREDRCGGAVDRHPWPQGIAVCKQLRGLPVVAEPLRCAVALEDGDLGLGRGGLADDPEHLGRLSLDDDRHPQGPLRIGPMVGLPVNRASIEVAHMHFFRYDPEGRLTDLWHVWNTLALARQLGAPAPDLSAGAPA